MLTKEQVNGLKKGDKVYHNNNGRITEWTVDYPRILINEKHTKMVYDGHDYKLAIDTPAGGGECQSVNGMGCIRVSMPTPNGRGATRMSLLVSDFANWSLDGASDQAPQTPPTQPQPQPQPEYTPATLSGLTPNANATDVSVNTTIEFTFTQPVSAGTGNVTISNGEDMHILDVTGDNVEFNGSTMTVVLDSDLQPMTTYTVVLDPDSVLDIHTNTVINVLGSNVYQFTTAA